MRIQQGIYQLGIFLWVMNSFTFLFISYLLKPIIHLALCRLIDILINKMGVVLQAEIKNTNFIKYIKNNTGCYAIIKRGNWYIKKNVSTPEDIFFILPLEREEGRKRNTDVREKHPLPSRMCPNQRWNLQPEYLSLSSNRTCHLVYGTMLHPTDPHQPGQEMIF